MTMGKPGRPMMVANRVRAEKTELQATEAWGAEASLLLRRVMNNRGWGYQELAEALQDIGSMQSAAVINRRINRGNFSAGFFLMCLQALGVANLEILKERLGLALMSPGNSEQKDSKPVPYAGIGTLLADIQRTNKEGGKQRR